MPAIRFLGGRDSLDAANLSETIQSPGWSMIRTRLTSLRQQYVDGLLRAQSWEGARYLQGQIDAVDRALEVPEILRREIAAKVRKNDVKEEEIREARRS